MMFETRIACLSDKESIREIYVSAIDSGTALDEEYWDRLIEAGCLIVALEVGQVVGFGGIDVNATEQLQWLYVLPQNQGAGVGSAILQIYLRSKQMKKTSFALALLLILTASAASQDKSKSDKVPIDPDQSYLVLSTKQIKTIERELDEVAAKGFRVLYGAPTQQFDMALLLKRVQEAEQAPFCYKVLATMRNKTMEKEMNEAASQGYRLLPRTVIFKQGLFTAELVMLMEREPKSKKSYVYKLIAAGKEVKLHKKIDESIALGFSPVTMITIGEHVIVMEKETEANK